MTAHPCPTCGTKVTTDVCPRCGERVPPLRTLDPEAVRLALHKTGGRFRRPVVPRAARRRRAVP
jgi:predicted RNA-binding protein with PUA domain